MSGHTIMANRAPVLTLWASIVAERLGFNREEALSLGKGLAGLTAQTKGRMPGIFKARKGVAQGVRKTVAVGENFWIELCERFIPAKHTAEGVRAAVKDVPIDPAEVARDLESKFGEDLASVRDVMEHLARSFDTNDLADRAYALYEKFRPSIPAGMEGWGAKGVLDLARMRSLTGRVWRP